MLGERDYVFASSFLRAADGRGTPRERLARFGEASSKESLRAAVAEAYGIAGGADIYERVLGDAAEKMRGALPDFSVMYPLLFKYDCNNIKTAIKCAVKNTDPDGLMFSFGAISPDTVISCAKKSSFSALPDYASSMRRAAQEAMHLYRKTGEARAIDLMLDAACFKDMKKAADEGGVELIKNIVTLRADGTNIMTCLRIAAAGLQPATAVSLTERAFVSGGDIPLSAFLTADGGTADAESAAKKAPYGSVSADAARRAAKADGFAAAEKVIDEAVLALADKFRFKPFGAEVAVRFFLIREAEMTNCRIIEAAMSGDGSVKERMRKAYV